MVYGFIIIFSFFLSIHSLAVPPIWKASSYVQADSRDVIYTLTGNDTTPTATMVFERAFTGVPYLGYGCTGYQGDDQMGQQKFQIRRTALTTASFSVSVQITGITNIKIMTVRFIGIEASFPHHLNSFDNVPVEYGSTLVNITSKTNSINQYTNIINYRLQTSNRNVFSTPLSNNKILLFLTSMFLEGSLEETDAPPNPITFRVKAEAISVETYRINVRLGKRVLINRLHFSIVIFDQADVESSGKYLLIYNRLDLGPSGGFLPLPIEFKKNFILGLTDFNATKTRLIIKFIQNFQTVNSVHGVQLSKGGSAFIQYYGFSYLYIKTWQCEVDTYFDSSQDLCVSCPIFNCINCFNLTVCELCDEFDGYYVNETTGNCSKCSLEGCVNCSVLNGSAGNVSLICLNCNEDLSYKMTPINTCQQCDVQNNFFLNVSLADCEICDLQGCTKCKSLVKCITCNFNQSYFLNPISEQCELCNNLQDKFINSFTEICEVCSLSNCIDCLSLTECFQCNQTNGFFLNNVTKLCSICFDGCAICESESKCKQCDVKKGYILAENGECSIVGGRFEANIKKSGCNLFVITITVIETAFSMQQLVQTLHVFNDKITNNSIQILDNQIKVEYKQDRSFIQEDILLSISYQNISISTSHQFFPLLYYSDHQCQRQSEVMNLMQAINILSYFILVMSVITCKIIGLELFGVLQLSYFSLSSQDYLTAYAQPLVQFRTFNGYNVPVFDEVLKLFIPQSFSEIGFSPYFINNFNVMFIVMLCELLLSFVLFSIAKILRSPTLLKVSFRFFKQVFIFLIIFNSFNIAYSGGLQLRFVDENSSMIYILSNLVLIVSFIGIICAVYAMQNCSQIGYGQFKDKFKNNFFCKMYIPLSICYRLGLGLFSSIQSDYSLSTLILLVFPICFQLYNLSHLPFSDTYQNYRSHLIHFTHFLILFVATFYRSMKQNMSIQQKMRINGPIFIQLIFIVICVAASTIALAYEIFLEVRNWKRNQNKHSQIVNESTKIQQTIQSIY